MEVQHKHFDEVFEFKGNGMSPQSVAKILDHKGTPVVVATELYNHNPGSSVTYAGGFC